MPGKYVTTEAKPQSLLPSLSVACVLFLGGEPLQRGFGKLKLKNRNSIVHISPTVYTRLSNECIINNITFKEEVWKTKLALIFAKPHSQMVQKYELFNN